MPKGLIYYTVQTQSRWTGRWSACFEAVPAYKYWLESNNFRTFDQASRAPALASCVTEAEKLCERLREQRKECLRVNIRIVESNIGCNGSTTIWENGDWHKWFNGIPT